VVQGKILPQVNLTGHSYTMQAKSFCLYHRSHHYRLYIYVFSHCVSESTKWYQHCWKLASTGR